MLDIFAPTRRSSASRTPFGPHLRTRPAFGTAAEAGQPLSEAGARKLASPVACLRDPDLREAGRSSIDRRIRRPAVGFPNRYLLTKKKVSTRSESGVGPRVRDVIEPPDSLLKRHETLIKELRLAEQVQRSMLPRVLPEVDNLRFGASLRPSLHLSGDFYNVMRLDRDHLGFYLGDVMGHGPAAALLGVFAMQGIRTKRIEGSSYELLPPADVLASLSHDLIQADFPESPFVTMIYGILNTTTLQLTYSCGGHPPGLLLRPGHAPILLHTVGPLLGIFESPFEQQDVRLQRGDRVVFYSDGVESMGWRRLGNGVEGLARFLSTRDGRSAQQMVDEAVDRAEQIDGPNDDLTVVMAELG